MVVGRAVAAFTGARLWCPCINTPYSYAIPTRVLWNLLWPRLLLHAARHARIPFPVLDFTTVEWTFPRQHVLDHLAQFNTRSTRQWTLDDLDMMHTCAGHTVVLTWPTEEGGRWMLARHALTYQSGWLSARQLREPFATPRSIRKLLPQMWTRQPRPLEVRYLRAYQHLPALR